MTELALASGGGGWSTIAGEGGMSLPGEKWVSVRGSWRQLVGWLVWMVGWWLCKEVGVVEEEVVTVG